MLLLECVSLKSWMSSAGRKMQPTRLFELNGVGF